MDKYSLENISKKIRSKTFDVIYNAGGGHFGGSLSVVEIMTVLYFDILIIDPRKPDWEKRDRFILSKGHAGPALYVVLSEKGFFEKERLAELDKGGGRLPKHVDRMKVPGVDYSSGPLGQGLSVANGIPCNCYQ